jgi:hypothetical protein
MARHAAANDSIARSIVFYCFFPLGARCRTPMLHRVACTLAPIQTLCLQKVEKRLRLVALQNKKKKRLVKTAMVQNPIFPHCAWIFGAFRGEPGPQS